MTELIYRQNYLWVKAFLSYQKHTLSKSPTTVERYRFFLRHILLWAGTVPLPDAHTITVPLSEYLRQQKNHQGQTLSLQTQKKVVETTRMFFRWAKDYHEREFRRLPNRWIRDLTPVRLPDTRGLAEYVTLDEVLALAHVPQSPGNLARLRDRAAAAMLFLSGIRAGAFVTLPVHSVQLAGPHPHLKQFPELGVKTKNGKRATTYLHTVPQLLAVVREWDQVVCAVGLQPETPWYTPIQNVWGEQKLATGIAGTQRGQALSKRLRKLQQEAGLPLRSPHKYRHGYAVYGLERCKSMAEYHALSRNMMHGNIAVTDAIYAHIEERERARLLTGLSDHNLLQPEGDLENYFQTLSDADLSVAVRVAAERMGR
jgi:site-specific recombinase XerD